MIGFLKHILKVAFGVGLVTGLFLFSMLLYVSDFTNAPPPDVAPVAADSASGETPLTPTTNEVSFNKRFLTWIFGEAEEQTP